MHLQIVDFNYRNYNVKCGYCKGVITYICSLIQTRDDDKPLTPNVGIAIARIVLAAVLYLTLDHLMQDALNLIKE
jgi:hypothetical protein